MVVNGRVEGPAWGIQRMALGFGTKHPNQAQLVGIGLQVGEHSVCG